MLPRFSLRSQLCETLCGCACSFTSASLVWFYWFSSLNYRSVRLSSTFFRAIRILLPYSPYCGKIMTSFSLSICSMGAPDHQITTSSRTSAHTGVAIPYGDAEQYDVVNQAWLRGYLRFLPSKVFRKSTGLPRRASRSSQ